MAQWSEEAKASFREAYKKRFDENGKYVMTEEHRRNLGIAAKKRLERDGANPNFYLWAVGKPKSEETKAKMRQAKLGKKHTAEHIANRVASLKAGNAMRKLGKVNA